MIDFKVLEKFGTTAERLRQVFETPVDTVPAGLDTNLPPNEPTNPSDQSLTPEQKDQAKRAQTRAYWERRIRAHVEEAAIFKMTNATPIMAVDLAFDSHIINKETIPLVMYAQGKLDMGKCAAALEASGCGSRYVTRDEKSAKVISINPVKFLQMEVNIIRSFITRRLAAQVVKYGSLWPHFKYEPRDNSQVGQLRADAWSQRADEMADQYGYLHHEIQVQRNALLYGQAIDFVKSAWDRQVQMRPAAQVPGAEPDPNADPEKRGCEAYTVKEGVDFVLPHPLRTFWNVATGPAAINCDNDADAYYGFWDIVPYGVIADNPSYWNKQDLGWGPTFSSWFDTYTNFFSTYYTTITPPTIQSTGANPIDNDRKSQVGKYSAAQRDSATLYTNYCAQLIPKDWGIGDYPCPVWVRFVCAGNGTVIFAEFLPSTPGCYEGYNQRDDRVLNPSFAMELMPFQDAMTNLCNLLLEAIRQEQIKIFLINRDVLGSDDPGETSRVIDQLKKDFQGANWDQAAQVVIYSLKKLEGLGVGVKNIIDLIQPQINPQSITNIFTAMAALVALAERLEAMSPNESGQPIVRGNGGVTATEATNIQQSTTAVYSMISYGHDEYRAAKKRLIWQSFQACAQDELCVPVINRYTPDIIAKAGFKPYSEDGVVDGNSEAGYFQVQGKKQNLVHDFIFTSRDGSERESDVQTATTLIQLVPLLKDPEILSDIGKEKFYELVNRIVRNSGTGFDLNLQVKPGAEDFSVQQTKDTLAQVSQTLESMMKGIETNTQDIGKINQTLAGLATLQQTLEAMLKATEKNAKDIQKINQDLEKQKLEKKAAEPPLADGRVGFVDARFVPINEIEVLGA